MNCCFIIYSNLHFLFTFREFNFGPIFCLDYLFVFLLFAFWDSSLNILPSGHNNRFPWKFRHTYRMQHCFQLRCSPVKRSWSHLITQNANKLTIYKKKFQHSVFQILRNKGKLTKAFDRSYFI